LINLHFHIVNTATGTAQITEIKTTVPVIRTI
jgi:hypothetical protein